MSMAEPDAAEQLKEAFRAEDSARVRQLLEAHPELKPLMNETWGPFDSPPIVNVSQSRNA